MKAVKTYSVDVVVWGLIEEYYNKKNVLMSENKIFMPRQYCKDKKSVERSVLFLEQKTLLGYQWNKIYRGKIIRENNIFFEDAILYEDFFFNISVMKYVQNMYILDETLYYYRKRFNESITTRYIPDYFKLSYRRVKIMNDLCDEWKIDEKIKNNILGNIYLRYILSALMRNCDVRSEMTIKEQLQWVEKVKNDMLFTLICSDTLIKRFQLNLLRILMNKNCFTLCVWMGKMSYLFKEKFPIFFSLVKRNK